MRDFNIDGVLVGRPYQEIWEQSEIQHYPIGTIHERHGKRFRYCRAYENLTLAHSGCKNVAQHGGDTSGGDFACMGNIEVKAYAGETSVIMENSRGNTLFPVDWFYNGTMLFYNPSAAYYEILQLRISGSDLADADRVKIYLDEPLPCDIADTVHCECHPSPYLNIGLNNRTDALYSVNVVIQRLITAHYYFWGQTRGPCYVQRDVGTCFTGRNKVFISGILTDAGINDIRQVAGYTLTPNVSDGMIQLILE